jgi:hypothetical protein
MNVGETSARTAKVLAYLPDGPEVVLDTPPPDVGLGEEHDGQVFLLGDEFPFPNWRLVLDLPALGLAIPFPVHDPGASLTIYTAGLLGFLKLRFGPDGPTLGLELPRREVLGAVGETARVLVRAAQFGGYGGNVWN